MSENPCVIIGGKSYSIPELNTGQIRRDWPKFVAAMESLRHPENAMSALGEFRLAQADLLLKALQNEYPKLTEGDIDLIPGADLKEAVEALVSQMVTPKKMAPQKKAK